MSELIEIIIEAIDQASDTFESIVGSAEDLGDTISGSVDEADSSFDDLESAADAASSSVEDVGAAADSLDGSGATEVASDVDEIEQEANESADALENMNTAIAAVAGAEVFNTVSDALMDMADQAGTYEDSITRMGLAAEGAGIDMDTMKSAVSNLSTETGRAGGSIRESFIQMTSAGITDMNTMQSLFKGASAQAFILGTDVEGLANKFSGMAMKSTLSEKTLKGTGITMQELGEAMGMQGATVDEVKAKWSELDVNQRAAALGMAASMNEGKDANDAYKHSWEGLQAQIDIAKSRIGRLVGEVLLPVLIPAFEAASRVLNWFGDVISAVMSGPLGGLVSVIGGVAAAIMLAIPAYMALSGAYTMLVGPAMAAATAMWAAVSPLLPFIAIGAAIVLIIYEIGKAFGWWTDASSMIDAIGAGLQKLWDTFINHPDVQALIQAISSGWEWLSSAVGRAWQAVLNFFGISSSSNFNVLSALIQGIGAAWDMIREPVMAYCDQVMLVLSVIASVVDGNMSMSDAVIAIWNGLVKNIPIILSGLGQLLGTIWAGIGSLMLSVVRGAISGIVGWFASLPGRILAYLTATRNYIFTQMLNWVQVTRQRAMQIITGILTFFRTLPGKVLVILAAVGRHILSQGMQWIVNAKTRATGVVNGVINLLLNLPGKVYSALHAAAKSILDAGKEWVDAAKEKAQAVVDGAYNTLTGLPGKISSALGGVADAITKPFKDAYNTAKGVWDKIVGMASNTPNVSNYGGFDLDANGNPIIETGAGRHDVLDVNISLKDVPDGVDETFLVEVITSRSVIDALVNNQYYQSANSTANLRYQGKVLRSG